MTLSASLNSTPRTKRAQAHHAGVLHLTSSMGVDPVAREVFDMALQTHRAGWRSFIASARGPLALEAERAAVRHTAIPLRKGTFFSLWRSRSIVESVIDKERPVLIHAHGLDTAPLAIACALARRLPFLVDLKDPLPVTTAHRKTLETILARGGWLRVPTKVLLEHLKTDFSLDPSRICLVPPGIDLDWYEASRVTPERLKKVSALWRIPEQASLVVMATPFGQGGGHSIALEALSRIKNKDIYAVFVGTSASLAARTALEKEIASKGLEGKVIIPDICEDWPAACWLATFVMAVNVVPRGQAPEILAAQAIGRPVIVTDCGANVELVEKDETAWVIPPNDADALTQAMTTALSIGPERRITLAIKTRSFVAARFPMEGWRDGLFALYDRMLAVPSLKPETAKKTAAA